VNKTEVRQLVWDVSYLKNMLSSLEDPRLDGEELHLDSLTLVWLVMNIERRTGRRISLTQPVTVDSLHGAIVAIEGVVDQHKRSGIDVLDRLIEPDSFDEPSRYYEHLRNTSPVLLYPTQHLNTLFRAEHYAFVSRYAEARYVMTAPVFHVPDLRPSFPEGNDPKVNRMNQLFLNNVLALNPPAQTERRSVLAKMLSARAAETLREINERLCDETVASVCARLKAGEEVDVHAALSEKVALDTIAIFMGVSAEDRIRLKPFAMDLIEASHPVRDEQKMAAAVEAVDQLQQYFSDLLNERRRAPSNDLTSRLAVAVAEGQAKEDDAVDMLMGLWITGFLSTAASIDAAIVNWLEDRSLFAEAARTPAGLRGYVNEVLRLEPPLPISGAIREATTDVELGGVTVPRGIQMIVLFGPVNRDPEVFERPEEFLFQRNNAPSMSLGLGTHYCVGANLARMEMSAAMTQLDRQLRMPVELGQAFRRQSILPRTYDRLEIRVCR
jgi:cytochrome P450